MMLRRVTQGRFELFGDASSLGETVQLKSRWSASNFCICREDVPFESGRRATSNWKTCNFKLEDVPLQTGRRATTSPRRATTNLVCQ